MKILLTTGIFFPDVGGPAIHVEKIANRLLLEGHTPVVIAYGDVSQEEQHRFDFEVHRVSRKYHKSLQWVVYFFKTLMLSLRADVVYAFDPTAAGVPARFASMVFFKPFLIRVGGDPIWEREAEMGRRLMPITEYYSEGLYLVDQPRLFKIIQWVITGADGVVFYNTFWKDFYTHYFGLDPDRVTLIKNPVFKRESADRKLSSNPEILFAGRFVAYKNLERVMNAFNAVREHYGTGTLTLIGKGPDKEKLQELQKTLTHGEHISFVDSVPQAELFRRIQDCSFAIGPALSEFNPNFILESLSFGKPVLLSKGHGLSVDLPNMFLFDPMSQDEIQEKMMYLFTPDNYSRAVDIVSDLDMNQTWENVTDGHSMLIEKMQ